MKQNIIETANSSLATITVPKSKTVVMYLSTDIHTEQSASNRALELLYTDALISGAGKYNREEFLNAVNLLGASVSVSISEGIFTVILRSKADVAKKVTGLIETMLLEPHFVASELKRIKQTTINSIEENKENAKAISHEQFRNSIYGDTDRRYTPSSDKVIAAIDKTTAANLKKLHKRVLKAKWFCSVAGDSVSIGLVATSLKKIAAGHKLSPGGLSTHKQKDPKSQVILRDIPSKQNIEFSIGAPVPITLHHPDYLPLTFGLAVLGKWGGFAGRLMSTVRELEGLTYGIYAKTETFHNQELGYWRIVTFFSPEKSLQGLTSTFRELKQIQEKGITSHELLQFKQILNTNHVLKNDSTSRLLADLHSYHLQKFSLEEIEQYQQRLQSLTKKEVNAVIKKYLDPKLITVSGAGPMTVVKKDLEKFMKSV